MVVARVLAAAGLVSSLTLALAPAMATEPLPNDPGATRAIIRRIPPAPPVAAPTQDAPASGPAADSAHGRRRLDELANFQSQVAALERALEVLLVRVERAIQRLESAAERPEPAPAPPAPAKRPRAVPRPSPPSPSRADVNPAESP